MDNPVDESRGLRAIVIAKIQVWEKEGKIPTVRNIEKNNYKYNQHLRELLGYQGPGHLAFYDYDKNYISVLPKLRMLAGPNGYTIYKMLLAKQNVSVHD